MPYTKVALTDEQVSVIKSILSDAVALRSADNAPKATMRGMDVRLGLLGATDVYVTSDVKAGWPGQSVRELAGGTLQRVAVFIAKVEDGMATATGYVALLKFTVRSNHFQTYYLEVSTKPSELGVDAAAQTLYTDTLSVLGFKGTEAAQESVNLEDF